MGKLILISGASRSGKSTFAEMFTSQTGGRIAYLATSEALDEEMKVRIEKHRQQRPVDWQTFEEPLNILTLIEKNHQLYDTWLLECVTLYISNLLFSKADTANIGENYIVTEVQNHILLEIDALIDYIKIAPLTLIAVTNEIGWGIVPADALSRAYSDIVGKANQRLAAAADEVYLVAMGIPLKLKPHD